MWALRRPEVPSWSTNSARSAIEFQTPASSARAVSGWLRARSTVSSQLFAERLHLRDIEEIGAQHGRQHVMGLADGFPPGGCVDSG